MSLHEEFKQKLQSHYTRFVKELDVTEVFLSYFIEKKVLIDNNVETILSKPTRNAKATEFLSIIRRRGPNALDVMHSALIETYQVELAALLKPDSTGVSNCSPPNGAGHSSIGHVGQADSGGTSNKPANPNPKVVHQAAGFVDATDTAVLETGADDDFSDGEYLVDNPDTYHIPIKVTQVNSQRVKGLFRSQKVYRSTTPRGRALIINNRWFDRKMFADQTELDHRDGSQMDCVNIKELFDQLGFITGEIKEDVISGDFEKVILEEIRLPQHEDYGAFILVIMTHGKDNEIFGADGRSYPLQKIVDLLSLKQFPAMGSKPKIIFLQACSGNRVDKQMLTSDGAGIHADSMPPLLNEQLKNDAKVNNMDDLAIVSASFPGYDSKRHVGMGTWFIRAVVEVFMKHAHHKEFKELIQEVRRRVRNEGLKHTDVGGQTVTMKNECLNKAFYFFPGL